MKYLKRFCPSVLILSCLALLSSQQVWAFRANYIAEPFAILADDGEIESVFIINPVISPDGRKITYEKNNGVDRSSLYLMAMGGKPTSFFDRNDLKARNFSASGTNTIERLVTVRTGRFGNSPGEHQLPLGYSFSPKSDKLVYGTITTSGNYEICIYDLETKDTSSLFNGHRCHFPSWSPLRSRDRIAFILVQSKSNETKLCILGKSISGSNWEEFYRSDESGVNDQYVRWAADGQRLLIVSEDLQTGNYFISVMSLRDRKREPIKQTTGAEHPVWLSSNRISYFKNNAVWVHDLNSGEAKVIVKNVKHIPGGPCWTTEKELFCINNGVYEEYESPMIRVINGKKHPVMIQGVRKSQGQEASKINKPVSNGRFLAWNRNHNFFIVVGQFHAYANYLYAIYQ